MGVPLYLYLYYMGQFIKTDYKITFQKCDNNSYFHS